jgi:hypothetical protein
MWTAPTHLQPGIKRESGQHHTSATLLPQKTWYPLYRRLGGPRAGLNGMEKLMPTVIRSPLSHYMNNAIPAIIFIIQLLYKYMNSTARIQRLILSPLKYRKNINYTIWKGTFKYISSVTLDIIHKYKIQGQQHSHGTRRDMHCTYLPTCYVCNLERSQPVWGG